MALGDSGLVVIMDCGMTLAARLEEGNPATATFPGMLFISQT